MVIIPFWNYKHYIGGLIMYCKNCGEQMNDNQAICLKCGVSAGQGKSFCQTCGLPVNEEAVVCTSCGCSLESEQQKAAAYLNGQDKITMALICFFLGGFGVHNFMMGEKKRGIMKIVFCFLCGISGILALIDLVKILTDKYQVQLG